MTKTKASAARRLELAISAHPGLVIDDEDEAAEFSKEVGDLDKIVAEHKTDAATLVLCVYAHRKLGDYAEAHEVAERALAVERSFATVSAAATVFRAEGELENAWKLFEEAAERDKKDASALMEAGKCYGEAERFADAERCFAAARKRDPKNREAEMWEIYAGYAGCKPEVEKSYVVRMRRFVKANPDHEQAAGFLRRMTGG